MTSAERCTRVRKKASVRSTWRVRRAPSRGPDQGAGEGQHHQPRDGGRLERHQRPAGRQAAEQEQQDDEAEAVADDDAGQRHRRRRLVARARGPGSTDSACVAAASMAR